MSKKNRPPLNLSFLALHGNKKEERNPSIITTTTTTAIVYLHHHHHSSPSSSKLYHITPLVALLFNFIPHLIATRIRNQGGDKGSFHHMGGEKDKEVEIQQRKAWGRKSEMSLKKKPFESPPQTPFTLNLCVGCE